MGLEKELFPLPITNYPMPNSQTTLLGKSQLNLILINELAMKVGSAYTRLLVSDLKTSFEFYKDVMGFEVKNENLEDGYAEFKVQDMKLSLFRRQEMAQMIANTAKPPYAECQDNVALIFTVHDVEEEYEKLTHQGVKFTTAPMNNPYYGIKTAYLRDPDGTLIGLFELLV